jgi:hypothetical protein
MAVAAWPSDGTMKALRWAGVKPGGGCHRLESPCDVPGRVTPSPRPVAMVRVWPRTCAHARLTLSAPIKSGEGISQTCGQPRAGCLERCCETCTHAR